MQRQLATEQQVYKISIIKSLAMLALILLIQFIMGALLYAFFPTDDVSLIVIANSLVQVGSYLLVIYLFYWRLAERLDFKLQKGVSIVYMIVLAVSLAFFALVVLTPLIAQLPESPEVTEAFERMSEVPLLALLLIVVIAPVFEEIIFRNIILKGLKNRYNAGLAILISSVLFGAFHLNFQQFISATILGLICGTIYLATDSVLYTILFHALYNTSVLFVSGGLANESGTLETLSPFYGLLALAVGAISLWLLWRGINRQRQLEPKMIVIEDETVILEDKENI